MTGERSVAAPAQGELISGRSRTIASQGLDETDLATNRAGRVSERQIASQVAVRRGGARAVRIMAVSAVVGCGAVGAWGYGRNGDAAIGVVMPILGLAIAAIPLVVYDLFRFADPAKVGSAAVTRIENAEVGGFLPAPSRGVYSIGLNGSRFSGFASDLTRAHLGARVNAYVVEEYRIVVALEPID